MLSPIKLGTYNLATPVLLAPMAGVTDKPMREMVRSFGAGLCYSEMIASQAIIRDNEKTMRMSSANTEGADLAVQIAGSDPNIMANAAKINEENGAILIDINCGCPVKKVVKGIAGSALMQHLALAEEVICATVDAVNIPVSVKMRLGWDNNSLNAKELAIIAQRAGAVAVTVHGRTRQQFYSGHADWRQIKDVVNAVQIPVFANGDIVDGESAKECLSQSGAAGIMIGRGIYGKPWLIQQIIHFLQHSEEIPEPSFQEKHHIIKQHFLKIIDYYGENAGVRMSRKHMGWYSKGIHDAAEFRKQVNRLKTKDEVLELIDRFFTGQL